MARRGGDRPPPSFHQLTFRRGNIWTARFGSDGKSVLYSAAWDGGALEIHLGRSDGPDSRPFGLRNADVLSVAPGGDLAVALGSKFSGAFLRVGTLARVAATGGGAPREILEGVEFADFAPDGRELAIVRVESERRRLEYPAGKTLAETTGWIGNPRFSPRGDRIAFLDHPVLGDDGGAVAVVDLAGRKSTLTPVFQSAQGLAWSPDGSELWYTAAESGGNRALRAVTLSGRTRVLLAGAGGFLLHDVARDGRVLMTHDLVRVGLVVGGSGDAKERDLSWFDWSLLAGVSEDGREAIFSETGEGGGPGYSVFLRRTDGSPAVRLGEGQAESLSADGKRVLAILQPTGDQRLVIYPTGAGQARLLTQPALKVRHAAWLPDGRRFLISASEAGHLGRIYLVDSEGDAPPKPLSPDGYRAKFRVALVDARRFATYGPDQRTYVHTLEGGEPTPVPGIGPTDEVLGPASRDGTIWMRRRGDLPVRIVRFDLATGKEEPYRNLMPADATGVVDLFGVCITRDGRSYAYSYGRILSDLFVVEGIK